MLKVVHRMNEHIKQKYKVFFSQVIVGVLLWNEMHCGILKDGFPCFQTLWHLYFLSKYNLLKCSNKNKFKAHWILSSEESKIERVTRHLQRLLHAALIKETRKFQESWKEKYKWLHFDENENKMFCTFAGSFQMEKTRVILADSNK